MRLRKAYEMRADVWITRVGELSGDTEQPTRRHEVATIEKSIDVGVPVSVAYDQWTQFEEFRSSWMESSR